MSTAVIITELGMTEIILSGLMVSMEKRREGEKAEKGSFFPSR